MAKKKTKVEFSSREERGWIPPNCVDGDRCVYCGAQLNENPYNRSYALATTRSFPVCGEQCAAGVTAYVEADRRKKTGLYLVLAFCAVIVLVAALAGHQGAALYASIMVAGAGFVIFPYPVTSFETFLACPIKKATHITRGIGVALMVAGAIFFLFA